MNYIFSATAESTPLEQLEQLEQIQPSDLTISNAQKFFESMLPGIRSLAFNIVLCVALYVIGKKVIRILHKMLERALRRMQADAGLTTFLCHALEFGLRLILIFVILGQLGINTASIITVMGTLMLAIGMSLQGSLSNVAGGILILLMHPFRAGHYIICDYGEGVVTTIGLVYTTLTTKDNRVITIPNGAISNCAVTDCGENPERRLDIVVGISYESDLRKAKQILQQISDESSHVLHDKPVNIFVDSLADSSVNLGLFCYVSSPDFLPAKWEITEEIKLRFDEAGISIPYPQVHVHMDQA